MLLIVNSYLWLQLDCRGWGILLQGVDRYSAPLEAAVLSAAQHSLIRKLPAKRSASGLNDEELKKS